MTEGWAPLLAAGPGKRWVSADEHSLHVWSGAERERSVDLAAMLGGPPRVLSDSSALAGRFEIDLDSGVETEQLTLASLLEAYDPMGEQNQLVARSVAWTADGAHALVFVEYRPTRLLGATDAVRPGALLVLAHRGDGSLRELDRGRHLVAEPLAGDRWLVSGGDRVRVVDPVGGDVVLDVEPDDPATAVATAGDVVVMGLSGGEVLGALGAEGVVSRRWPGHDAVIDAVAVSGDSLLIASGDRDGELLVRNWADGSIVRRESLPGSIDGLCFLTDHQLVVAIGTVDELRHIDLDGVS